MWVIAYRKTSFQKGCVVTGRWLPGEALFCNTGSLYTIVIITSHPIKERLIRFKYWLSVRLTVKRNCNYFLSESQSSNNCFSRYFWHMVLINVKWIYSMRTYRTMNTLQIEYYPDSIRLHRVVVENGTGMRAVASGRALSRFIRGLASFSGAPLIRIDKA